MSTNSSSVGSSSVGTSVVHSFQFTQNFRLKGNSQCVRDLLKEKLGRVFSSYVAVFGSLRHVYENRCDKIADTLSYLMSEDIRPEAVYDHLKPFTLKTITDFDFGSSKHHLAEILFDKEKKVFMLMPQTFGVELSVAFSQEESILKCDLSVQTPPNENLVVFQSLRLEVIKRMIELFQQ